MAFIRFSSSDLLHAEIARHDSPLMRTAHRHDFSYEPREGFLYVKSRAISSRTNDNFDTFPAEEIKKGWQTFIGKPVFVNHHNDDHKRARGVIIDAALHEDTAPDGTPDTWVEVLMEIDAVNFPKLAAAILAGDIERTSMGCDVAYSLCSVCGNKASSPVEYCSHIPRLKGKKIRRKAATGNGTEDVLVHEVCCGLSFFENSVLVEPPADPTAFFLGVDSRGVTGMNKAASRKSAPLNIAVRGSNERSGNIFSFESQASQFDETGPSGISYEKGGIGHGEWVDCLLWRDGGGKLRGILYHYPFTDRYEKTGNVNLFVDPNYSRRGVGSALMDEGIRRFNIDLFKQKYTDQGIEFIKRYRGGKPWNDARPKFTIVEEASSGRKYAAAASQYDIEGIHYEVRFRNNAGSLVEIEDGQGCVEATVSGHYVGALIWDYLTDTPEVLSVEVEPQYRRHGVASQMWEIAVQHESQLAHSTALTDDGRDWVRSLSSTASRKQAGTGTMSEAQSLLANVPQSLHDRVNALLPFIVYGPDYNRGVDEELMNALRMGDRDEGYAREWFIRKAESKAHYARTGEWIKPIHPRDDNSLGQGNLFTGHWVTAEDQVDDGGINSGWGELWEPENVDQESAGKTARVSGRSGAKKKYKDNYKGNTTERGYGWDHQKKREELLKDNPNCHHCKKRKATEADHYGNGLVPSCSECNNKRSHEQKKRKKTAASVGEWVQSDNRLSTYFGLSESLPVYVVEAYNGDAAVAMFQNKWFWNATGRDNSEGSGTERSREAAQDAAMKYLSQHAELEGQLSLFSSRKTASYYHANVTWETSPGKWRRGLYTRISRGTGRNYDSEWDDDYDYDSFEWVSPISSSRDIRPPRSNPGVTSVYPYDSFEGDGKTTMTQQNGKWVESPSPKGQRMADIFNEMAARYDAKRGHQSSRKTAAEEKPELITWDEWEMNGSSNYGLGYAAGKSSRGKYKISIGEAMEWANPTDVDEFMRGWNDGKSGAERTASRKLSYGEVKAPAAIDTLRIKDCPVCGEDESWDSDGRCRVCGYLPSPEPFREPDLEVAQRADMRDGASVNPDLFKAPAFREPEDSDEQEEPSNPVKASVSPRKYQRHKSTGERTMRPTIAAAARQQQIIQVQADRIKQLEATIRRIRRRADVDNPAQPWPDGPEQAPAQTTDEARAADYNVTVTQPGGFADASPADYTIDVTQAGGVAPAWDAVKQDVTSPVSGYQQPVADMRTEVDVNTDGETIGDNAYAGDWANTTAKRAEARTLASLRLARLRIEAGIAETDDDITLAQTIARSRMSDVVIRTEINTLSKVKRSASAAPARRGSIRPQAVRNVPSLVSTAAPVVAVAAPSMNPSADEFLFD